MSNLCYYQLVAAGPQESVEELYRRLRRGATLWWLKLVDHTSECRFEGTALGEPIAYEGQVIVARAFDGEVANSISTTLCDDETMPSRFTSREGGCVTLSQCARDLDLEIEVFGDADAFAEHYRYAAGTGFELIAEEREVDYVYWDSKAYPTFDDLRAAYDLPDSMDGTGEEPDTDIEVGGFRDMHYAVDASAWVSDHSSRSQEAKAYLERINAGEPLVNTATGEVIWRGTISDISDEEAEMLAEQMAQEGTWRHATYAEQLRALAVPPVSRSLVHW